jgi:hypothetical protein
MTRNVIYLTLCDKNQWLYAESNNLPGREIAKKRVERRLVKEMVMRFIEGATHD